MKKVKISKEVVEREMLDQTILLNLDDGEYYSLNSTAAFIWGRIKTAESYDELRDNYQQKYQLDLKAADADLKAIIHDFENAKLLSI